MTWTGEGTKGRESGEGRREGEGYVAHGAREVVARAMARGIKGIVMRTR